ncbi:MAG TPA: DUF6175 family protein [Flavobacteriales bacterium]|nr:DUF6175 family protein [Flavobacteriales bacterium]
MKTRILFALPGLFALTMAMAQAKKPTLMVVPADNLCVQKGYTQVFDNQGTKETYPDFTKALQNDFDLYTAISKIGEIMADRGFPLKDLEMMLKEQKAEVAENMVADLAENPIDQLYRVAKADIILQLNYKVEDGMRGKKVSFDIRLLDAYSMKMVGGASGTGQEKNTGSATELLQEAVLAHMDKIIDDLTRHFDDLFANGREVTLKVRVASDSPINLMDDVGGEELNVQIENWVHENTVKHRFSWTSNSPTETRGDFEQVRIPLYGANDRALDTRTWARGLQKHLKDTYNISAKLLPKGLGSSTLVIGK